MTLPRLAFALAAVWALPAAPATAAAPAAPGTPSVSAVADAELQRITFHARADGRGTVVRLRSSGPLTDFAIEQEDGRATLTIRGAALAPRLRRGRASGAVRTYDVQQTHDGLRLTFVSGALAQAYADRDSDDLLVAFTVGPRRRATRAPIAARPASPPVRTAGTTRGSAAASAWQLDTIVLDAGHGGNDHGAVANGTSDKQVAIGVVRRLGRMIEEELGIRVVYTRDDDTFVELRERGRIANREGGKLFISVHANAARSSRAHGTETFFLAPHRSKSAREVMERENSVIEMESDPSFYADFDDEGGILAALAMSAYQEESQSLATLIESEFKRSGRHSRGVKQAGFKVLWAASMPAVLVETGFITNPDDARLLKSSEGLDETARAIFRAVELYREQYERGLRVTSVRG